LLNDCETCKPLVFGACCLPSGQCEIWQEVSCVEEAGGIFRGEGITCGDFNGNGIPDTCEAISVTCPGDLNTDGTVDATDFLLFLAFFGPCP